LYFINDDNARDYTYPLSKLLNSLIIFRNMELDDKTILQVNATLIAGILIFLSFSSTIFGEEIIRNLGEKSDKLSELVRLFPAVQIIMTVILLIPFGFSATGIIYANLQSLEGKSSERYRQGSLKSLGRGIYFLVIALLIIAFFHVIALYF
jgi:hypothetical protein